MESQGGGGGRAGVPGRGVAAPAPVVQVLLGAKDITANFSRQASSPSSLQNGSMSH